MPSDEKAHLLGGQPVNSSGKVYITVPVNAGQEDAERQERTDERGLLGSLADHLIGSTARLIKAQEQSDEDHPVYDDNSGRTMSNVGALVHLIKGNLGTGIIGLPAAFMYSGVVVGFVMMLLICIAALNCMQMLAKASHRLCDIEHKNRLSYAGVAESASKLLLDEGHYRWAKIIRIVVQTFLLATQLGFCAVYFVFIPANLQQVLEACGVEHIDVRLLILAILPIIWLGSLIEDLNTMALFSAVGNVLQSISLLTMFIYLATHLNLSGIRLGPANPLDLAMFFGMAMFSVEGIGVVLPLENSMKRPRSFFKVVNGGMSLVTVLYLTMGTLGYMTFGDNTKGSITLNLPAESNAKNIPYILVKLFYSVSIMSSFFIQFYVAVDITQKKMLHHYVPGRFHRAYNVLSRTVLVIICAAMAAAIPKLGLIISLVGAIGSSALAMIFPAIIYIIVFRREISWLVIFKNCLLILFGLVGMVLGTYVTCLELASNKPGSG